MSEQLTSRHRDFLLLTAFVLAQHGYTDRAAVLIESLFIAGDVSSEVMLARAVLRFQRQDWLSSLTCLDELDRLDPVERFGQYKLTVRQRMRRFLKARCLYELDQPARARDAIDVYLRQGSAEGGEEE